MKLYGKLFVGIAVVEVALLGVVAFVVQQSSRLLELRALGKEVDALVQEWNEVQIATTDLLLSDAVAGESKSRWDGTTEAFRRSLLKLTSDQRVLDLGGEVPRILESAKALWSLTSSLLLNAERGYGAFLSEATPDHPSLKLGNGEALMDVAHRLELTGALSTRERYLYYEAEKALRSVSLSNETFKTVLRRLSAVVEVQVAASIRSSAIIAGILILLITAATLVYVVIFARRLARRFAVIEASVGAMAKRDFSKPPTLPGRDEIGLLSAHLGDMAASLSAFFAAVRAAAGKITALKEGLASGTAESAAAVGQIARHIGTMKDRFVVLDTAIEQAGGALEDIHRYLVDLKDGASRQAGEMERAGEGLEASANYFSVAVAGISDRARSAEELTAVVADGGEKVQTTAEAIALISRDIQGVLEITDLIDQISEQTNILSMNAAIESAHAGAAGKGFAVVAEEIRKLAESTQDNAQRISDALAAMTERIEDALASSATASRAFDAIDVAVRGFSGGLDDMSAEIRKESSGFEDAIAAIRQGVQDSKRISEGTAEMYQRQLAIGSAMENVRAISSEALAGIVEIDAGTKEILSSVAYVSSLGEDSRERIAELEEAVRGFVVGDEATESSRPPLLAAPEAEGGTLREGSGGMDRNGGGPEARDGEPDVSEVESAGAPRPGPVPSMDARGVVVKEAPTTVSDGYEAGIALDASGTFGELRAEVRDLEKDS